MPFWRSHLRALQTFPPATLEEIRPLPHTLVLRCFQKGCAGCSAFAVEGEADYERTHFRGIDVVPWDCADPRRRAFATSHGIDQIPAYLVIDPDRTVRVLRPPVP